MRGVAGLPRAILWAKAQGFTPVCAEGTAEYEAFEELIERGLLTIIAYRDDAWAYTAITKIGIVVLKASER